MSRDEKLVDVFYPEKLHDPSISDYQYVLTPKNNSSLGNTPLTVPSSVSLKADFQEAQLVDLSKAYILHEKQLTAVDGNAVVNTATGIATPSPHGWSGARRATLKIYGKEEDQCNAPALQAALNRLIFDDRQTIRALGPREHFFPLESSLNDAASESAAATVAGGVITITAPTPTAIVDDSTVDFAAYNQRAVEGARHLLKSTAGALSYLVQPTFVKLDLHLIFGFCAQTKLLPISSIEILIEPETRPAHNWYGTLNDFTAGFKWNDVSLVVPVARPGNKHLIDMFRRLKAGEKIPLN